MGGQGSSRWHGRATRDTVESTITLSIFRLRKQGMLMPGWTGLLTALDRYSMQARYSGDALILSYSYRPYTSSPLPPREMHYSIQIEQTQPHFGGVRHWFRCPECARRSGKLYFHAGMFVCRLCADLAYQSSREMSLAQMARMLRRSGWSL